MSLVLTAQQMVNRARSLAELPNAQFITYQDALDSLNEAYNDVYEKLIESDDDYYVNEVVISPASYSPVANTMSDEYLIPLPPDFYKLRTLLYFDNNYWHNVDKFPIRVTPLQPSKPMYRLKGAYLHLIGMAAYPVNSLRLDYYPPPAQITLPDITYTFGNETTALTQAQTWAVSNAIDYTPVDNTLIYYIPSTGSLYADSLTLTQSVALLSGQVNAITNIDYYKGSIYYIQSGNIYSAVTDLQTTPIVPTAVINTGNVVNFTINNVNGIDYIYFWNGTNTVRCTLAGGSQTTVQASFSNDYAFVQGVPIFLTSTGAVNLNGSILATALASYSMLASDGTNVYLLDPLYNIHLLIISNSSGSWIVVTDTILFSNIFTMGPIAAPGNGMTTYRFGVVTLDTYLESVSATPNYAFAYPPNATNEIISYQMGIDFARKAENATKVSELTTRLAALWARYQSQQDRDDYQYERIGNFYSPDNRYM